MNTLPAGDLLALFLHFLTLSLLSIGGAMSTAPEMHRYFGWRGALAAITGMLLAPFLIVIALAASYERLAEYPAVAGALRGMGAVAAGLILAMAFKMLGTLRGNLLGPWLCAALGLASLVAIAVFRLPLAWIVIGLGLLGWGLARWRVTVLDARAAHGEEMR